MPQESGLRRRRPQEEQGGDQQQQAEAYIRHATKDSIIYGICGGIAYLAMGPAMAAAFAADAAIQGRTVDTLRGAALTIPTAAIVGAGIGEVIKYGESIFIPLGPAEERPRSLNVTEKAGYSFVGACTAHYLLKQAMELALGSSKMKMD